MLYCPVFLNYDIKIKHPLFIYRNLILKLKGLQEDALYNLVGTDKVFSGSELMYAGLMIPKIEEDFYSNIYVFKKSV